MADLSDLSTLDVLSTLGPAGRASLLLAGSLDAVTAAQVDRAVAGLAAEGASSLVIDLEDLRFIDSHGVATLLDAGSALGGEVTVCGAAGLVRRVIDLARAVGHDVSALG